MSKEIVSHTCSLSRFIKNPMVCYRLQYSSIPPPVAARAIVRRITTTLCPVFGIRSQPAYLPTGKEEPNAGVLWIIRPEIFKQPVYSFLNSSLWTSRGRTGTPRSKKKGDEKETDHFCRLELHDYFYRTQKHSPPQPTHLNLTFSNENLKVNETLNQKRAHNNRVADNI